MLQFDLGYLMFAENGRMPRNADSLSFIVPIRALHIDFKLGSMLAALESSLRYKSPPAEETVRHALEADVSLDEIFAVVVDFYGQWTVGEKEHTISYLNAVLQTAKFLGAEEALLPLAIGLSKLPF